MPSRLRVFSSSVGTKLLIGITGLALFGYLLIHIAGNLVVFLGPDAFNRYAFVLESNPLLIVIDEAELCMSDLRVQPIDGPDGELARDHRVRSRDYRES